MMEQKGVKSRLRRRVIFRVSEEDYKRLHEVAKTYKVKQAEFLRQLTVLGLDAVENSLRLKLIRGLIKEVNRVGVNLNQIARWVNTYKDRADAQEVLAKLDEIERYLQALLKEVSGGGDKVVKTW